MVTHDSDDSKLYHIMYPIVFFYSSNYLEEFNSWKRVIEDDDTDYVNYIVEKFISNPIESHTFSKNVNPIDVTFTSSGTIILKTDDYEIAKRIVNSLLLSFALLTGHTCFSCKITDLDPMRNERGNSIPLVRSHVSIGRATACSKAILGDEFNNILFNKQFLHKDTIAPIVELAEHFYESKNTVSYQREFEALYQWSVKNYDVAFILYWVQIELFLKRNLRSYNGIPSARKSINSLIGVDQNGRPVRRKTKLCGKYIPLLLARDINNCYEIRKNMVHEGKECDEKSAELCKEIAEKLQLWRLIDIDRIDYDSYLHRVRLIIEREEKVIWPMNNNGSLRM
ncbi:MAG: hypothetical protein FWG96_06730 [Methanomassiliicoccaceae archaeon]|nr:hypothetical protein [Methanomassiliicoccaceae archaeon]